jgi:multiple sugar transport system permease protein
MNNMFAAPDYQKLSAAAVLMALVMVVIIAVLFKIEDWFGKDVEG